VLRAMGYMTEQPTLTSKKQTVTVPFWVNCLLYSGTNNRKIFTFPSQIQGRFEFGEARLQDGLLHATNDD
jgi:hypothetical protein